ncbi:MAG: hypothetical protein KatS3mg105_2686 [Gemmatales bacterium]|nr:MAG: hypothetical protein KatS3mg105_2686 [Gemmatales bacterium]
MGAPVLRPQVRDLVFQLFGRPVHPEFFDIVAERRVRHGSYEVVARITRTGHAISWDNGKVHLTEVTTADEPLPQRRLLFDCRLRGEHQYSLVCSENVHYQTSFQVETLPPEIFLHVHDEILEDGAKRGMLHNFCPHHRLALAPLGFVSVEARPGCLFLTSFHTFPDEFTVIKTQSLIEMTHTS